ncbi:glycosyl transferase family 2 [Minicystis rosea]|nr:glycosyl transferase family 2 [Minicystis rosea]
MTYENGSPVHSSPKSAAVARKPPVTAMIYTLNEERNLPACLDSLAWCDDVIVVDSFSTDRTEAICRERGVRFFQHAFEGFGSQRNWAADNTSPRHEWILVLDADERVPPEMVTEMAERLASAPPEVAAYRLKRRFHLWGRWLKHSSLYPTWVVRLIHKDRVRYVNRGHAETQEVLGETAELESDLIDENAKGILEWFERQTRYARKDAEFELSEENKPFRLGDVLSADPLVRRAALKRIARRAPGRAPVYFAYSYLLRGGFRDGEDGLVFCTMRALYQQMVNIHKYDLQKRARKGS